MSDSRQRLLPEINKRLTLNLLIQGSAEHAFLTSHHLVRDELNNIDPELLALYDRVAVSGRIQHWSGMAVLIMGRPERFWQRAASDPTHPFYHHPLLSRFGPELTAASKRRALERSREKGVRLTPGLFSLQLIRDFQRILKKESPHKPQLTRLAVAATSQIWGIDPDRLDGSLTKSVEFGDLRPAQHFRDQLLRASAAGYGGVLRRDSRLVVVARAWIWPLLSHELVKGTVELICLHGLTHLSDEDCAQVLREADRLEFEPWMLQAGPELWRRLLALLPAGVPVPRVVMRMARLPPEGLERLVGAVLDEPEWARELLASLDANDG